MRVVVALGGNALLRRGEAMTIENQQRNVAEACGPLARVAGANELVIAHGNGPQIGLLALEGAAYPEVPTYPLDVLGAETQGMVGYLIERELANRLGERRPIATLLTMIEVDERDPAFADPTKPIGPLYGADEAEALASERGWSFRDDGGARRRVVPSPTPRRIVEHEQVRWLLERGCVVICGGGGGIPTARHADGRLVGVEAVIDKDRASQLLAVDLAADAFVTATDTDGAYVGFGTDRPRRIAVAHPDALLPALASEFPVGSMLPKVTAACEFVRSTGRPAAIGALADIEALLAGAAGTQVRLDADGIEMAA